MLMVKKNVLCDISVADGSVGVAENTAVRI